MAEPPPSGRLRPDSTAGTVLLTALVAIGSFSVSIYTPSMPALVGLDRMILIGCALAAIGTGSMVLLALSVALSAATLIGPMMLFSLGMGLVLANAMAGGLLPFPRMAGIASALLGFAQMALAALATMLVAALPPVSAVSMSGVILLLATAGFASHVTLAGRRAR
jgi:DHA1 family bicyclomycin/chloramphenicol resistance-like MFS transporter